MRPPHELIRQTLGIPGKPPEEVPEYAPSPLPVATPVAVQPAAMSDYVWEAILEHVAQGLPLPNACRLEGVSPQRVQALLRARPDLASQVAQAKQGLVKEMLGVVVAAAREGEYRAAQWMVNRLDPPKEKASVGSKPVQTLSMERILEIKNKTLEDLHGRTK